MPRLFLLLRSVLQLRCPFPSLPTSRTVRSRTSFVRSLARAALHLTPSFATHASPSCDEGRAAMARARRREMRLVLHTPQVKRRINLEGVDPKRRGRSDRGRRSLDDPCGMEEARWNKEEGRSIRAFAIREKRNRRARVRARWKAWCAGNGASGRKLLRPSMVTRDHTHKGYDSIVHLSLDVYFAPSHNKTV